MNFLTFEVKGYRRLGLNSINLFRLEMTEIIQVILGRNGSGKSSVLAELNPFPADASFFTKDGHKIICIRHKKDHYTLKSVFKPHTRHSFIKNDEEELNPGGTATVQKDLCKQIFGVTTDLVSVISGSEKFTTMSGPRRRELLTLMCDVDYDYALKVYEKIRVSGRDATSGLKLAKKRLVSEMANLFTNEEYELAGQQLRELTTKSQELYQLKNTRVGSELDTKSKLAAVEQRIKDVAKRFWDIRRTLLCNDTWTPAEIQEDIDYHRSQITVINTKMSVTSERHEEISRKLNNLQVVDDEEYKLMQSHAVRLVEQIESLSKALKTPLERINPIEARQTCERIKESLMLALMALPSNDTKWYTPEKLQELSDEVDRLREKRRVFGELIAKFKRHLAVMEEAKKHTEAECPECKHRFLPGYDAKVHTELVEGLAKNEKFADDVEAKLQDCLESYAHLMNYRQMRENINNIALSSSAISVFWDSELSSTMMDSGPAVIFSRFERFEKDVKDMVVIAEKNKELAYLKARIANADMSREKGIQFERDEMARLEDVVLQLTIDLRKHNDSLASAIQYQKHVKLMLEVGDVMRALKNDRENALMDACSAVVNRLVDDSLTQTHADIAALSAKLNNMRNRLTVIADIKSQITALEDDEQAFKMLASVLSPTDGLIAEGLLGFIRSYVGAMNKLIKRFWTYRMTVKSCSAENGSADLKYNQFPIETEGDSLIRPDVSNGSSGMKEVIDLAFRFVAMHYTHLSDYPLFLDEFGAFFDAEHKSKAPYAIKSVIEQMQFSQVFIITHHDMDYGAFPNAQFCVLDKNNIVLNSSIKYNEHVVIE